MKLKCLWKCCCKDGLKDTVGGGCIGVVVACDVGMSVVDSGAGSRGSG